MTMLLAQLLHSATGQPPQERLLVAICGITKLFVGELVETGVVLHCAACGFLAGTQSGVCQALRAVCILPSAYTGHQGWWAPAHRH